MSKGGSTEVKETSYQKAEADVAKSMWDDYQTNLKPYENVFINKVGGLNDESNFTQLAGDAATQTTSAFHQTQNRLTSGMTSGGVDPSSGKFKSTLGDLSRSQAASQIDTTNRAQNDQQNKYIAVLQDVVALGAGQKGDALSGYSGLANSSASKAASDAESEFNNHANTMTSLGQAAGLVTKYSLGK